jgi:ACS family hexuronate transporter-like MFS transporter
MASEDASVTARLPQSVFGLDGGTSMGVSDEQQLIAIGDTGGAAGRATNYRWVICGLLFIATTVCYLSRSVLNLMSNDLKLRFNWTNAQYGNISAAFTAGYAIGFIIMGRLIDRIGTKYGYAVALVLWSLALAAMGFARTALMFAAAQFSLGIFEAGNFPAAARTTAEWFPQRRRAAATGIFNAGSNVGVIAAALMVPALANSKLGWPVAFIVTGLVGLAWVVLWLPLYSPPEQSRFTNTAELDLIHSDSAPQSNVKPMRWREILPYRQCWCIMAGKFLTDPVWYFYLFWSGLFLADRFHVSLKGHLGLQVMLIYIMADFGSIIGGYISSILLSLGQSPNAARKTAMLICGMCVLPVAGITFVSNVWVAVALLGLAAASHQGFSANLLTLPSDMFPRRGVASVSGLGGLAGAVGGILMQTFTGHITGATHSYRIPFIVASVAYLVAVAVMHLISPRLRPVETTETRGFDAVAPVA